MIFGKKNKFHNHFIFSLPEPCFLFDGKERCRAVNDAAREIVSLLGYGQETLPETRDQLVHKFKVYGDGKDLQVADLWLGSTRYMIQSSECGGDLLVRLLPVREDEHMMRLSSMLDVIPWGLVTLGLQSDNPIILHSNRRAEEMFGMTRSGLTGMVADDVFGVFGIEEDMALYARSPQVTSYDHEGHVDGRVCWYRLHFIPYAMQRSYCLIVMEDTTDRKIMEGQYFQAQRLEALGRLAGGVAHDFNNILSVIDGYARLARKALEAEDHPALKYTRHIASAVQRGAALTGQLLTFGNHKVVKDSVIDLGMLVSDQEPLLRPLMDASIALAIKADSDVFVQVAPDNICQIILNLCINARDAMVEGGSLIVEVEKETEQGGKAMAVLRVIDTGCGMTSGVRAKMFDPFFTTKDQGKGTGLGLSMVYGLVKDMGGSIDVLSKEGEGTAITIRIPLSEARPVSRGVLVDGCGNVRLEGFTALVAEDEADLLDILSGSLEDMGITVLRASNGNEALLVQDEYDGDIDFLLTDVVMPEMNGVRLAELFGSIRPDSQVMFMSGYPANNLMARVNLPEGAVMMSKPLDMEKLSSVIRVLAENPDRSDKAPWREITREWRMARG